MTGQDYEIIANAIRNGRKHGVAGIVTELVKQLAKQNPRFDATRFSRVCMSASDEAERQLRAQRAERST